MLKVPSKYKRLGLFVKCLKCKCNVSNKCGLTKKPAQSCEYKNAHRYYIVICIPNSGGKRKTKILKTLDFDQILMEIAKFREEVKRGVTVVTKRGALTLENHMANFLDEMSGVNTPAHKIRKRSELHIEDCVRAFTRFKAVLSKRGYNFSTIQPDGISDTEVGYYHSFLKEELNLGLKAYNKHMAIMKALFNRIKRRGVEIVNPFNEVEIKSSRNDPQLITKVEFDTFISSISRENSFDPISKKYLYRDWLVPAYKLALETGLRREELLQLKWTDVVSIDDGKYVLRVNNLKVTRLKGDERLKYIPVTRSLWSLLEVLGYNKFKGTDRLIIPRPEQNLNQAKDLLSRGFAHFIKYASDRPFKFGILRKVYITKLTIVAGPNAKLFTGSASDIVLQNHYLSRAFMAANLEDFSVL